MHPDIEKLINLVREGNELTERQREIILRKAEKLGEDVDEVEMILETIAHQKPAVQNELDIKKRKCPNCGTIISGYALNCPECGYVFQKESAANKNARDYIKGLSEELIAIEKRIDLEQFERDKMKATAINTFTVPNTVEALVQLFSLSYSNYEAESRIVNSALAPVWLGKAKSTYLLLKTQTGVDDETRQLIIKYSFVEGLSTKEVLKLNLNQKDKKRIIILGVILFVALDIVIVIAMAASGSL